MVNLSYMTVNINIGKNFWKTAALVSGAVIASYGAYKFISSRRRRAHYVGDVTKKCVLITGCDSGFGRALAKQLDEFGCPVFAGCLTSEGAKSLNEETSDNLQTLVMDVTSSKSIQEALEYVTENMVKGCLFWGVVNNAGITGNGGPIEFQNKSDFEQVMQVNFLGMVDVIQNFLPLLKKHKGRIVNMASMAAMVPVPNLTAYVASKYAVLGYSEALRREKHMWGIHVSSILPGVFATNFCNFDLIIGRKNKQWESLSQDIRDEYGDDYMQKTLDISQVEVKKFAKTDLTPVTDAIEHALFSAKPQSIYKPGIDSQMMILLENMSLGFWDRFWFNKGLRPKILDA